MAHPPFPVAGPWANYPRFKFAELEALEVALVVDGNLEVEGKLAYTAYVNGNILCDSWTYHSIWNKFLAYRPETELTARQYVLLSAEDHESLQIFPALRSSHLSPRG